MIRGFFFDLDGTLVNTHSANFEAYRQAIQEVSGVEIVFEEFKNSIGQDALTFLPRLAPGMQTADYARMAELKAVHYKELMHLTQLNTELANFMQSVTGIQIVLVTSAKRRNADAVLEHHKLQGVFDFVITAEDVSRSKPAPDAYLLALQKTGLRAEEALAFEDSRVGITAAESAGVHVVPINNFAL